MQLHRTNGQPDWVTVSKQNQSSWQQLAVASNGVVTPGNICTCIGLGLVVTGLYWIAQSRYWLGGLTIACGRLCDLLDGWLAELTRTKSPLGELLDASFDKVSILITLLVFGLTRIAPWWALLFLALPQLMIIVITFTGRKRHSSLHPSQSGKLSMAIAWLSLLGFIVIQASSSQEIQFAVIISCILVVVASGSGLAAAYRYLA